MLLETANPEYDVTEAKEIEADDPIWKTHAAKGEQAGPSGGDKPPR
jgi:hypothetical protein